VNNERARIEGFEVKGRYQLGSVQGGRLDLPFSYGQARGTNLVTGAPLNSIEPAKTTVGVEWSNPEWVLSMVVRHHAAKRADEIDSAGLVKAPKVQITAPSATTVDLNAQWKLTRTMRLNLALINLTNRTYWNWSDVRGLDAASTVAAAYTQPGRHARVMLVADF
jgi:hemoglobin/transferrin/lactoferrin receptor protein